MARAKKIPQLGLIRAEGILAGCPAAVVRHRDRGYTVRLLETRGAWQAGDIVCLGSGEFAASATPAPDHASHHPQGPGPVRG